MLNRIRGFFKSQKGNLVENLIYIIIIGALCYTFYNDKIQQPMSDNMDKLNDNISQWTAEQGTSDS